MGEMWEDDPALDPGSTTVGTPPPSPGRDAPDAPGALGGEPDAGADAAETPDDQTAGADVDVEGADSGDAGEPAPDTTDRPTR